MVGGLHKLKDQLRAKARRDALRNGNESSDRSPLSLIPFSRSFYKESEPFPETDVKFRILSLEVLGVLNRYKRVRNTNLTREQWEGFRELRQMTAGGAIRISVSDKGGEFVVSPLSLDREITELHLADVTVYCQSTDRAFRAQCSRLNAIWMSVGKSAG